MRAFALYYLMGSLAEPTTRPRRRHSFRCAWRNALYGAGHGRAWLFHYTENVWECVACGKYERFGHNAKVRP